MTASQVRARTRPSVPVAGGYAKSACSTSKPSVATTKPAVALRNDGERVIGVSPSSGLISHIESRRPELDTRRREMSGRLASSGSRS